MRFTYFLCSCLLASSASWPFAGALFAAERITIIRDTEIENTIRAYTAPLFAAAGLDAAFVRIHLIMDHRLNAFVAGGQQIFLHTGLLRRAENAGQVIGVLSHEVGHISGGHLARLDERLKNASAQSIVAMVLAIPAAIVAGDAQVAAAVLSGGTALAYNSLLQYTRTMESSADQAAMSYLDSSQLSAQGMLEFLELLLNQEALYSSGNNSYLSSHPITRERVDFVRNHLKNSKLSGKPLPAVLSNMHRRMRGKLNGFIDPPEETLAAYSVDNPDIEAKYARAIALMRQNDIDEALAIVDGLLAQSSKDPFFLELKGDILRNAGRVREAIAPYQAAVLIAPWAALIRVNLAQAQLELNDNNLTGDALKNINEALRYEPGLVQAWHLAAIAHGRRQDFGNLALALAERSILQGRKPDARRHVKQAQKFFPEGSPGWQRAQDIGNAVAD
jgi:predicted Zn-dependent protease